MPGHVEVLLGAMAEAGVSGAFIIQPGNHLYDHSYCCSVLREHRDTFVGALLANPTTSAGVEELERLIVEDGFKAVRFNPYLWPDGEQMTNEVGRAMYRRAGELGAPVGHMPFKGLLRHMEEIRSLARDYPETKFIIDHMGFCKASDPESEEWRALLSLAEFPQAYVKAYPYTDVHRCLRRVIDTFGPRRVMWGSDFPWVTEKCGYVNAWNVLPDGFLSDDEEAWIYSKTLMSLFPDSFAQGRSLWADVPQ